MAADITSRSISGEFDSFGEKVNPATANEEEGFIAIDSIAGDFEFVLVHALELFGSGHSDLQNSMGDHNGDGATLQHEQQLSQELGQENSLNTTRSEQANKEETQAMARYGDETNDETLKQLPQELECSLNTTNTKHAKKDDRSPMSTLANHANGDMSLDSEHTQYGQLPQELLTSPYTKETEKHPIQESSEDSDLDTGSTTGSLSDWEMLEIPAEENEETIKSQIRDDTLVPNGNSTNWPSPSDPLIWNNRADPTMSVPQEINRDQSSGTDHNKCEGDIAVNILNIDYTAKSKHAEKESQPKEHNNNICDQEPAKASKVVIDWTGVSTGDDDKPDEKFDNPDLVEKIRNMKFNFNKHKHSKHKDNSLESVKKKKWKPLPPSLLGFNLSLLYYRQHNKCDINDVDNMWDYDKELDLFENELCKAFESENGAESVNEANIANGEKTELNPPDSNHEIPSEKLAAPDHTSHTPKQDLSKVSLDVEDKKKRSKSEINHRKQRKSKRNLTPIDFHSCDMKGEEDYWFENCTYAYKEMFTKLDSKTRAFIDTYEGVGGEKRLRRKKKWNFVKSHKAKNITLGHCRQVYTRMKSVYVNRRAMNSIRTLGCLQRNSIIARRSLKEIDKGIDSREWKQFGYFRQEPQHQQPQNAQNRQNVRQQPRHALNRNNADNALDADLVNILINLQERDLTPEDYELLLRLDDRVAPKTVNKGLIENLIKDTATEADTKEVCTICMDHYVCGEERKYLPCGHIFHSQCIEQWLTNSSQNCPLDNVPVEPS